MRKTLLIALGGVAVIALALTLRWSMVNPAAAATAPARAAATTPDVNKLRHTLAQQSNEIRRLTKTESALLSELGEHVTDLAKPEPPP